MALAVTLSIVSVGDTTANLSFSGSGGVGPLTFAVYRSETEDFTPGSGNMIASGISGNSSGASSTGQYTDSGLIPNTKYYWEVIVTDTGNSNATADSSQENDTTTVQTLNPNQFAERSLAGMCDLRYNINTVSAMISPNQSGGLVAGQAVVIDTSLPNGGVPQVIAVAADTDLPFGFINFDIKTPSFVAGDNVELSLAGNAMYLWATEAITRGAQVTLPSGLSSPAAVAQATGSSGFGLVGYAFDGASAAGVLIRVMLSTPNFSTDGS